MMSAVREAFGKSKTARQSKLQLRMDDFSVAGLNKIASIFEEDMDIKLSRANLELTIDIALKCNVSRESIQ